MTERIKYDRESASVKNNLVNLKEKEAILSNSVASIKMDIENLERRKCATEWDMGWFCCKCECLKHWKTLLGLL